MAFGVRCLGTAFKAAASRRTPKAERQCREARWRDGVELVVQLAMIRELSQSAQPMPSDPVAG
jgi:hypothetical protein